MARQMLLCGELGAPGGIPEKDFATIRLSKPKNPSGNGYIILSSTILQCCPWGTWEELCEGKRRLRVEWDVPGNRVVLILDDRGDHVFGVMEGWVSQHAEVVNALWRGLVPGRHPARWEENVSVNGVVVSGKSLVVYPLVLR